MRSLRKKPGADALYSLLFVGPAVAYMLVFAIYPVVYNLYLALCNMSAKTFDDYSFVGFDTFKILLDKGVIWTTIGNTAWFTLWCTLFQFSIGLAIAVLLNRKNRLAQNVRGTLLIGWMLPITVTGILFKFMFQTDIGIVNHLLRFVGLPAVDWLTNSSSAMWAVILANTWIGIPFDMVLLTTGLAGIAPELYESAQIDGASRWQSFWRITLPMLKPTMFSIAILGVIYTFKVFDLVVVMTMGGPVNATEMMSTYAYKLAFREYNFSQGSAAASIMFLLLFLAGVFYLRFVQEDEVMS